MSLNGVPKRRFREKISLFSTSSTMALLTALVGLGEMPAQAVDPQIITTAAVCTGAWGTGNTAYAGPATKIYAPSGAIITSATVPYASASTKSSARISIYSNNGSLPGPQIGYFTFSSEASNVATFTGSPIILPSAGFYWVQLGATSSQMNCFTNTANYSGSNAGWLSYAGIAYGSAGSGYVPTSWAAFGSPQNAYQINFSLFGIETGSGSIALASLNSPAAYRVSTAITATTTGVGKATFFQNRKVIASCKNLSVSGSSVTCNWKPSTHGALTIYAKYTPTGGTAIQSNSINVSVIRRTTTR
jgi:hypothetical protein